MARTKGTLNLSGTLEVKAGGPLDARSLVPTLADLTTAANFPYPYVGMETYVVAENKKYRLIATPVTSSSNWEEVGSGGGGGGEDGGKMLTGTLLAASWSSKAQTVSVTGLKSDTIGAIGILNTATAAQVEAAREAVITPTTLANGTISFTCENVPSVDIPFGVMIPGGGSGGGSGVPDGGTTGQVLAKKSNTDGDVEWKDPSDTSKCYKSDDENINTITDNDSIPLKSATHGTNRNILFSDLKAKLKQYFDTIYGYVLPKASSSVLGGIKVGSNLTIQGDGTLNSVNNASLNFSTTEKVVGTWIDGKPIYQKTFKKTVAANSTYNFALQTEVAGIKNLIDYIIKVQYLYAGSDASVKAYIVPIPIKNSSGGVIGNVETIGCVTYSNNSNQSFAFVLKNTMSAGSASFDFFLTLQYTKTTD